MTRKATYPLISDEERQERQEREEAQVHADRYIVYTKTATRWYEAGNSAMGTWWDGRALAERVRIPSRLRKELDRQYAYTISAQLRR